MKEGLVMEQVAVKGSVGTDARAAFRNTILEYKKGAASKKGAKGQVYNYIYMCIYIYIYIYIYI